MDIPTVEVTAAEMRELKNGLDNLEHMAIQMGKLSEKMMEEVDISKRRLAFINHPAGRAKETLRKVRKPVSHPTPPTNLLDYKANKENN